MKIGRYSRMLTIDMASPPIVPIANGYQNDSFVSPIRNGMNPRMDETTVSSIGVKPKFYVYNQKNEYGNYE